MARMNWRWLTLFLGMLLFSTLSAEESYHLMDFIKAVPKSEKLNDFQLWSRFSMEKRILGCWSVEIAGGYRWKNDASRPFFRYQEFRLLWDLSPNWTIAPTYRKAKRRVDDKWRDENIPMLNIISNWDFYLFQIDNRMRVEYKSLEKNWYIRDLVKVTVTVPLIPFGIDPFATFEGFLRDGKNSREYRWAVGVETDVLCIFTGRLGYLQRKQRSEGNWDRFDIIILEAESTF